MIVQTFLNCSLHLISCEGNHAINDELAQVVTTLDLLPANLALGLIFLYRLRLNTVLSLDSTSGQHMQYYMVVTALVLANKFLHDQSYTLKTWHGMLTKFLLLNAPLAVLNQLEAHFLAALDYLLSTKHDTVMWAEFPADPSQVAQLRAAVDPSYTDLATGLATPPMRYMSPSCLTYLSYSSTPVMAAPVTPASQPLIAFTPTSQTLTIPWTTYPVESGCKRRRLGMGQPWLYIA